MQQPIYRTASGPTLHTLPAGLLLHLLHQASEHPAGSSQLHKDYPLADFQGRKQRVARTVLPTQATIPHMQRLASLAWSSDQEWIQSSDSDVKLLCFYYCPRHPEDIGCLWNDSRQASYQQAKVLRWWKQLCTKAVIGEKEVQPCFSNRFQFLYFTSCNQDAQYSWGNKTATSYFGYYFVNRCMASYLTMGTLVWVGSERE